MKKTAALICITTSFLLTACIFDNQPAGESSLQTSLQTKNTTSPTVTVQTGTTAKGAASDKSVQVEKVEKVEKVEDTASVYYGVPVN